MPGFKKCGAWAVDGGRSAPGGRATLGKGLGNIEVLGVLVLVLVPRPGKARLGGTATMRSFVLDGHRPMLPTP